MWQINGQSHIERWLEQESDAAARRCMLDWLRQLATDPESVDAMRLNQRGAGRYTAEVPGTTAFVDYIVAREYRTIKVFRVDDVKHFFTE